MAYDPNNVFAKILRGELPCQKVYEDTHVLAFRDIRPQAPVHVLVVPKRHLPTLNDLTPEDDALVGKLVRTGARIARERGVADRGWRLVANVNREGGQVGFHVHVHVLGGRGMGWPPG